MRYALIMAGGSGTRFWPRSSVHLPKQLLRLTGKRSQIQLSSDRLQGLVEKSKRWIVCTEALAKQTKTQLLGHPILAEPVGRNTMAAVCWGAWSIFKKDPEASIVALPADAHISDVGSYQRALEGAFEIAEAHSKVVCLGIKPHFAATGYGYIQNGVPLDDDAFQIARFIEKPNEGTAREFVASGQYAWNAGIFVFKAKTFIEEVKQCAPEFAAFFEKNISSSQKIKKGYKNLPKISIDVALMEKTHHGAVIHGDFGWNDVGSWKALEDVLAANSPAGLIQAKAGSLSLDSSGCIVSVTDKKFVGLVGVKDIVLIETPRAILICQKNKSEQVKDLVGLIEKNQKLKRLL